MPLAISTEATPLETDADGKIRMRGSRVTLDTVVTAFGEGATAEEIVQQYPTLSLADVYAVISYYLRNQGEVDAYLGQRREQAKRVRSKNESRSNTRGLRERLMSRRAR